MLTLTIKGLASNQVIKIITITKSQAQDSLLNILTNNGIPIASSCQGEGVCLKCIDHSGIPLCQIDPATYYAMHGQTITISYL